MNILLTGASGALGRVLGPVLQAQGHRVQGWCWQHPGPGASVAVDLRDLQAVQWHMDRLQPELLIHTAALTDVDACEQDPDRAFAHNVTATVHLRQALGSRGVKVIHMSTNDVFDGRRGAYTETDVPQPINVYARSKYLAEQVWQDVPHVLIVRATFLAPHMQGKQGFFAWVCEHLRAQQPLRVVTDQWNAPLSVGTLSQWIAKLLEAEGICHLASERLSRYAQACAIARELGADAALITPCTRSELSAVWAAPRPADVSLVQGVLAQARGLHTTFAHEITHLLNVRG